MGHLTLFHPRKTNERNVLNVFLALKGEDFFSKRTMFRPGTGCS
jgi:hypothetical protein